MVQGSSKGLEESKAPSFGEEGSGHQKNKHISWHHYACGHNVASVQYVQFPWLTTDLFSMNLPSPDRGQRLHSEHSFKKLLQNYFLAVAGWGNQW